MRLRAVMARDMREGMRRIREQLGDDAVIVSTEETEEGVLITAATERPFPPEVEVEPGSDPPGSEPFAAATAGPTDTARLRECLSYHGVPTAHAREILSIAAGTGAASPTEALGAALDRSIGFSPLVPASIRHPLMLVGEAGAGKTVVLAKLAAQAKLAGREVIAATADTARAGGVEQLAAFMRAIGVGLRHVESARGLADVIAAAEADSLLLIDTPAVNPLAGEMFPLPELLFEPIEPLLVVPAGLQAEDVADSAKIYAETLGVRRLVATRLDTARRYGAVVSAARGGRISIAGLSASRRVAEGVETTDAAGLAALLLNQMASSPGAYRGAVQTRESP